MMEVKGVRPHWLEPLLQIKTCDETTQQSQTTPSKYTTDIMRHDQAILLAVWTTSTYDTVTPNDKIVREAFTQQISK